MLPTYYIESDLVVGNNHIFREYDMTAFAANAAGNVGIPQPDLNYDLHFEYYISMIQKALYHLDKLSISPERAALVKKYDKDYRIDSMGGMVKELMRIDSILIRPQYLTQMVENIGLTIDRACRGTISKEEVKRYVSSDITNKVKRQMVRSDLPVNVSIKELTRLGSPTLVPFTTKYVSGYPYEFISEWAMVKKKVVAEANDVMTILSNARSEFNAYVVTLKKLKGEYKWDNRNASTLYYISYNAGRELLDAVGYLTFITIRKIGLVANNIIRSNEILDRLATLSHPITEGVLDALITKNDSRALGLKLIDGQVDAFEEVSNRIYEYHKGIYEDSPFDNTDLLDSPQLTIGLDNRLDQIDYEKTPWEESKKMYGVIQQGLSTIAKNTDDYLAVFDDILEKSGFHQELIDRFAGTINLIDDIAEYESAVDISKGVSPEMHVYYRMMSEVRDYPKNMEEIAEVVSDCSSTLNILFDRFDRNINGEYKNTLTVREAKNFLASLKEQFETLTISVGSKFMLRLKGIAVCLEKFDKDRSTALQNQGFAVESHKTLFGNSVMEFSYRAQKEITDILFEAMEESYQVAKVRHLTGLNYTIESSKVSDLVVKLKSVLIKWFEKVSAKLKGLIGGPRASEGKEFIAANKSQLLNKSYANVDSPIQIIEYEKLCPADTLLKDMKFLIKNTSSLNLKSDKLETVTDEESASNILFGSRISPSIWTEGDPSRSIAKYYKCGDYPENPVTVKNGALKTMVEDAIKYCEEFYVKYINELNDSIMVVKDNIGNNVESLLTESHCENLIGTMFMEADDDQNQNDESNQEYKPMDSQNAAGDQNNDQAQNDQTANQADQAQNAEQPAQAENPQPEVPVDNTQQPPAPADNQNSEGAEQTPNPNASDKAQKLSDLAKKIEMLQRMVQKYCNGVLTAAFDRYRDYMNLLKSLVGETPEASTSSTDEEAPNEANQPEQQESPQEAPAENPPAQDQQNDQQAQPQEEPNQSDGSAQSVDDTGLYS